MKNIAKILKECPKGTKLYSPLFGEVEFYSVENNEETNICNIVVLDPQDPWYSNEELRDLSRVSFSSDGRCIDGRGECMLFPTKAKDIRDWNTFAEKMTKFENGDFVVSETGIVGIYRERLDAGRPSSDAITHCHYSHGTLWIDDLLGNITRRATDDEKQKLLDKIDENGYVWDVVKLKLRKKEYEFEPYEKVLIRDSEVAVWCAATFSHINENSDFKYNCGGTNWKYCIPYKGNESLRGTATPQNNNDFRKSI